MRLTRPVRGPAREEGLALVIALMVAFLSFVIATAVLAQAIHNVTQSGYGRKRLATVNAAEAGLNWFTQLANTQPQTALSGTGWTAGTCASMFTTSPAPTGQCYEATGTAATVPQQATYRVRVMYSTTNPCPASGGLATPCSMTAGTALGTLPGDYFNLYARVQSTGTVDVTSRTLESYIRLRPIRNGIKSNLVAYSTCLTGGGNSRIQVDGTLYVEFQPEPWPVNSDGSALCPNATSGGSFVNVGSGDSLSIYAQGGVGGSLIIRGGGLKVCNTCKFFAERDVWAETEIQLGGTSASTSLASCPSSSASQCVNNDVKAPIVTFGSNAYVGGKKIICSSPCAPDSSFPQHTWNPTEWTSAGWTVSNAWSSGPPLTVPSTCGTATPQWQCDIRSAADQTVFYIAAPPITTSTGLNPCDVNFTGSTLSINTKVAIVSQCRFVFERSGAILSGTGSLLLISASPAVEPDCRGRSVDYGGVQDVLIANNQTFSTPIYIYTPCVLRISGNQDTSSPYPVAAQFAAKYLYIKNSVRLSERDVAAYVSIVPGTVQRFFVDVKFVREIPRA